MRKTHVVRGVLLGTAVILLTYSMSIITPGAVAQDVGRMLASAATGVSVGVAANPYNTLAVQLSNKEAELNAREQRIIDIENDLTKKRKFDRNVAYASLCVSAFLFVLVGVNYYLDFRRRKFIPENRYSVNLR